VARPGWARPLPWPWPRARLRWAKAPGRWPSRPPWTPRPSRKGSASPCTPAAAAPPTQGCLHPFCHAPTAYPFHRGGLPGVVRRSRRAEGQGGPVVGGGFP